MRESATSRGAGRLLLLDRDGVINHDSSEYIKSPSEWRPIARSLQAIARLNHAGWRVAVATNQSGVGRALFDLPTLHAIHRKMTDALAAIGGRFDAIFFCSHLPDAHCACRKPEPGMLIEAMRRFGIHADRTTMVGDSLRDLRAADAAGCAAVLVLTGHGAATHAQLLGAGESGLPRGTGVFTDLASYVDHLLE